MCATYGDHSEHHVLAHVQILLVFRLWDLHRDNAMDEEQQEERQLFAHVKAER